MAELGEKIRKFRKAKGLTQQGLELAIGASCGHVSRIESGQLNPTKETLLKIAQTLGIDEKEFTRLVGLKSGPVSKDEIEMAEKREGGYLHSTPYPAFLEDDFFFVHDWNQKMLDLLGVEAGYAELFRGVHVLEIVFNDHLEFRRAIPESKFKEFALSELNYFIRLVEYFSRQDDEWVQGLLSSLERHPDFDDFWKSAIVKFKPELTVEENYLYLEQDGKEQCFYMSVVELNSSPRFRIVEYIPQN